MTTDLQPTTPAHPDPYVDRIRPHTPPASSPMPLGPLHPTEMAVVGLHAARAGFTADRLRATMARIEANTEMAARQATMANTAEVLSLINDVRMEAYNQAYQAVLSSSMPGARHFANRILPLMQQPLPVVR